MLLSPLELLKLVARKTRQTVVEAERPERRKAQRYGVNPLVQLPARLIACGPVESDEESAAASPVRELEARLVDCSRDGVRVEATLATRLDVRQLVGLSLQVDAFDLNMPCTIANVRKEGEVISFGLKHEIGDSKSWNAYRRLLDALALGSTLIIHPRSMEPNEAGYLKERYVSDRPASLTVWRHCANRAVVAFSFQLRDGIIRVAYGDDVQYLRLADQRPADPDLAREIHRRFNLAFPNVAPTVPDDVRDFMSRYAA